MAKHVYEYDVDLEGDSAPARVIRMCRPKERVLEIGAGPGSISRRLKTDLGCNVVCLERDPSSIKILRAADLEVLEIDLNDRDWPRALQGHAPFQTIVIADVLEHVYEPLRVLRQAKNLLSKDGQILLSIPNLCHKAVIASLMNDNFEYRDWGLLDKTHIRFFGIKNIQTLIESAELKIQEAEFVVRPPAMMEFSAAWGALHPTEREIIGGMKYGDVYQVVSRLKAFDQNDDEGLDLTVMQVSKPKDAATPVKLIAFYLPQFHPVEVNDLNWGKGFTEWTNVTRAKPLFEGHYQPHLPSDLGFYDLRLEGVRKAQEQIAQQHGIDGFCYHYYWFSGERVLEGPLDAMLRDQEGQMPFCLCWANENWTRKWDGNEQEILLKQNYAPDDDLRCILDMLPYLKDRRYIRYNGRPLIIIYNPRHLRDAKALSQVWRDVCKRESLGDPFLVAAQAHGNKEHLKFGFDATVEFPPHNLHCQNLIPGIETEHELHNWVFDYVEVAEEVLGSDYYAEREYAGFRTVVPSWDNTARTREHAGIMIGASPENYEVWLDRAIRKTEEQIKTGDRFVFINAWNEWAEGAHLEPDQRYGRGFLEATWRAKRGLSRGKAFSHRAGDALGESARARLEKGLSPIELARRDATKMGIHIGRMYNSFSWKVTAPLRSIMAKFGVPELGPDPGEEN